MSQKFFPGKVLIVDDKFSQEIKDLISALTENGYTVQYWNSKGGFHENISAVRILILDLNLDGGTIGRGTAAFYASAADVLNKIKGPYIVIIYAIDFVPEDIDHLKEFYKNTFGPFEGFIEGINGLSKGGNLDELFKLINNTLNNKEIFKLILTWERILEKAKDTGLSKFVKEKFAQEMYSFVRSIGEDVGEDSLPREFISNMMRFLSRYVHRGLEYDDLKKILKSVYDKDVSSSISEPLLQHRNMFFTPDKKERIWTGDIYRIKNLESEEGEKKYWRYQIVLTPACNIAQNKSETYMICKGFPLDVDSLIDQTNHPLPSRVNVTFPSNDGTKKEYAEKLKKFFAKKINFPKRFHFLWNFSENDDEYIGLCFDFQQATSINPEAFDPSKATRICRLDTPFVDEMLQKFGSYSSRIGIPEVNIPHVSTPE